MARTKVYGTSGQSFTVKLPPNYVKEHNIAENAEIDLREDDLKRLILTPKDVEEKLSVMNRLMEVNKFLSESKLKIEREEQ